MKLYLHPNDFYYKDYMIIFLGNDKSNKIEFTTNTKLLTETYNHVNNKYINIYPNFSNPVEDFDISILNMIISKDPQTNNLGVSLLRSHFKRGLFTIMQVKFFIKYIINIDTITYMWFYLNRIPGSHLNTLSLMKTYESK